MTVEFDVPAEMRDGTILRANIYRPDGPGPWPVLLCRTPYGKDFAIAGAGIDVAEATKRGFLVVLQDTRGRFRSAGDWRAMVHEADDGADTVRWVAGLPDTTGKVGMYGASYFGFTQWAAASTAPPELVAIAPYVTWSDPFDGLIFRGGALELGLQSAWHLQMGMDTLVRRHHDDPRARAMTVNQLIDDYDVIGTAGFAELPLRDFGPLRRNSVGESFFEVVQGPPSRDGDLAGRTAVHTWHGQNSVASFNIAGWYDIFLSGTIQNYLEARRTGHSSKLLIGPWLHGPAENPIGEINFGFGAQAGFIDRRTDIGSLQLNWFDHWLREPADSDPTDPPVRLFVMGINQWRQESEWPLERAETVAYYLHSDGALSTAKPAAEAPDGYDYDPTDPTPTRGGPTLLPPDFPSGPYDQRRIEERPDVLTFTTEPLEHDQEVTGPIQVRLWAASSAPDTDFVARLCDVFPDGRSINLTDGIIRARYRDGIEQPSLIEPGQVYEYLIDLWATSNVFLAGHRIRVQVTSSCFPRWDRNPNTGHEFGADTELTTAHQQIWHDTDHPSQILLPLVPSAG
ncbi:MAG TPA: CocE/NonD family hydrolase [Mycobacteriales bacterium]|nr:CocE/NonD family hydrolase [Mycobacteriales bacterium]